LGSCRLIALLEGISKARSLVFAVIDLNGSE
jgi:hypothetical protein